MIPKLNNKQLEQIAEFLSNLGLVFFASVITPLFTNIDTFNVLNVLLGLGATIVCLIASMRLLKKG